MIQKLRGLFYKHMDIISYLFFGGLTTVVNYLVYFPLYNYLDFSGAASNTLAWCVAVMFAYLTNKPFVFKSHDWSAKTVLPEFCKFLGCRVGSGALETGIIWLTVDCLHFNGNWMKIATAVVVIVLNYVSSKLLVFRKK